MMETDNIIQEKCQRERGREMAVSGNEAWKVLNCRSDERVHAADNRSLSGSISPAIIVLAAWGAGAILFKGRSANSGPT